MCFNSIQEHACGHQDKDWIPCEKFCETGECDTPEEDKVIEEVSPECAKCKDAAAEEEHIQHQLHNFGIQESLEPSTTPRPRKTRDPNAPKLYFKQCIEWERCKHWSHARPCDIERESEEDEYLPIIGRGQCFDCSMAKPSVIARMKQNGDYQEKDPWGALSRAEIAEGSSNNPNIQTLEDIAFGGKADKGFVVSRSPSPDRRGRRSVSVESDDDTGLAKGKGRMGEPIIQRPHGAIDDSDASDEEGQDLPPSEKATRDRGKHEEEYDDDDDDDEEGEEGESEEESDAEAGKRGRIPNWSTGGPASFTKPRGDAHRSGAASQHTSSEDESGEESGDEVAVKDQELAGAEELKAAGMPPHLKISKAQAQSIIQRKQREAGLAMDQHRDGEIKELH